MVRCPDRQRRCKRIEPLRSRPQQLSQDSKRFWPWLSISFARQCVSLIFIRRQSAANVPQVGPIPKSEQINHYYQTAISELEHIKYHYTEAHLLYACFLQQHSTSPAFEAIYQAGQALAEQHHYRYLQYGFEQLTQPSDKAYDPADYPLPGNPDFSSHIQLCMKAVKQINKMGNQPR